MGVAWQSAEDGKNRLTIEQDDTMDNPRHWDTVGTMICWHGRYEIGDSHNFPSPSMFLESMVECDEEPTLENARKRNLILPVYLLDHSGISLSTSDFNDPWDSGQVGFIYTSYETIEKEWGDLSEKSLEKAKNCLLGEVSVYTKYLNGSVWAFLLETRGQCETCLHEEWSVVESCGGFYDEDLSIIKEYVDEKYHELVDELL